MHKLPFPLLPPPGTDAAPIWSGSSFVTKTSDVPVLCYSVGASGWTDELTTFHEEAAGDQHYIDRASRQHACSRLRRWLNSASPVLFDIGCSSGFMLQTLRTEFPAATVVGADYVKGPLLALSERLPDLPLIQFDLTNCPLPDECADGIVLLNVLEHIERDDAALKHIFRILKPGGLAVIEVPAGPQLYDVYDKVLHHFRRYTIAQLVSRVEDAGLEVIEKSHLGFFIYPPFWLAKIMGRRHLGADAEMQRALVSRKIKTASSSRVMHALMKMEHHLRDRVYFPVGVRCLVTCRKPLESAAKV